MAQRSEIEIIDTGIAPEFFVTHMPKWELIGESDCVRLYACSERPSGQMMLQYTVIVPRHCLAAILADCQEAAPAEPPPCLAPDMARH